MFARRESKTREMRTGCIRMKVALVRVSGSKREERGESCRLLNYQREMAIFFVGLGGLLLIWTGSGEAGSALLGSLVGFIMGELNGIRKATA